MAVTLKNNLFSLIPFGLTSTDTALVLPSGEGMRYPVLDTGDYYFLTIVDTGGNYEIVKVIGQSGDVLQIVRGQVDTTPKVFPSNSRVELRVTVENVLAAMGDYLIL